MKLFFPAVLLCLAQWVSGQSPLRWNARAEKTGEGSYVLHASADIPQGWWLYATADEESGLVPVAIEWDNDLVLENGPTNTNSKLHKQKDAIFENKTVEVAGSGIAAFTRAVKINGIVPASLKIRITGFTSNGAEFVPVNEEKTVTFEGGTDVTATQMDNIVLKNVRLDQPLADCGETKSKDSSLLTIFLVGLLGGFISLFTPCVFPMIPLTVSFFTKQSISRSQGIRNAALYGAFITLIYVAASAPFHLLRDINPQLLNTISTNTWVNLVFFFIFIVFALSFFGLFEIKLPASFSNAAGNRTGIFFMALTLALVSFSCTGPILGSLLVGSLASNGGAWQLTAGMGGFGLALALPFTLFALFPNWMQSLPKSGGWLDVVKKVLAFVELALAFKFLSNADLVGHWGILKREIFIGIWLLIALGLSLYLFGHFGQSKPSLIRRAFASAVLLFTIYLAPGLTNTGYANLSMLSGFPPPLHYSIYEKGEGESKGLQPDAVNDYNKALQLARQQNKPLLIDFTGWACVNCRRMEENVWTQPEVASYIKENFILVSLYVDDRAALPADERFSFPSPTGEVTSVQTAGDKWAVFQSKNFKQVTQPLYVLLSPDEELLVHPVGYTPDIHTYTGWLECGWNAFNRKARQ